MLCVSVINTFAIASMRSDAQQIVILNMAIIVSAVIRSLRYLTLHTKRTNHLLV